MSHEKIKDIATLCSGAAVLVAVALFLTNHTSHPVVAVLNNGASQGADINGFYNVEVKDPHFPSCVNRIVSGADCIVIIPSGGAQTPNVYNPFVYGTFALTDPSIGQTAK